MYITKNTPPRIKNILRRVMNSDKFWDCDAYCERVHKLRRKVNARYPDPPKPVGRYSGLTASELAKTGTCETDWF